MTGGNLILVGIVGAPHGVRGELRLKSYTSEAQGILAYRRLKLETGETLEVAAGRPLKDDMLVVRFAGISDRDRASELTNKRLYVDRASLPPVDDEEFYHADLVGLDAVTEAGAPLGRVLTVQNYGAGDMLEIAPAEGGETVLVPFTKAFAPIVDLAAGRIVVTDTGWAGATSEPDDTAEDSR